MLYFLLNDLFVFMNAVFVFMNVLFIFRKTGADGCSTSLVKNTISDRNPFSFEKKLYLCKVQ